MQHFDKVKAIVGATIGVSLLDFEANAALLGSVPELDSLAVVEVIAALEDQFGVAIDDGQLGAGHFTSVRSLAEFIDDQLDP